MPIVFLVDDRVGTPRSCWTVPQETTLHGGTMRWSLGTAALSKQKPVEAQLVTDASQTGWEAVLSGKQATGYRDKQVALIPSNYRESLAILLAIKAFENDLKCKKVQVFSENVAAVAYINHLGGPIPGIAALASAA